MAFDELIKKFVTPIGVLAAAGFLVWVLTLVFNNLPNAPTINITEGNVTTSYTIPEAITKIAFLPVQVILENIGTVGGIVLAGIIIGILLLVPKIKDLIGGLFEKVSTGF